jgi:hypothetical protein
MSFLHLLLLLPSTFAAFLSGLYGLNPAAQLFRLQPNGTHEILSNPLPYLLAQQLSAADSVRGIFYFIGFSRATSGPFLVGLSLADGSTLSESAFCATRAQSSQHHTLNLSRRTNPSSNPTAPLPEFYDGNYVGVGCVPPSLLPLPPTPPSSPFLNPAQSPAPPQPASGHRPRLLRAFSWAART